MPKTIFIVGDRVWANSCAGTVKYVGPVDGTKGEWYGVDWDNAVRGKHDGTFNNKRYFTTKNGSSGSFVKEKLLTPAWSCSEAIMDKYGKIDDDSVGVDEKEAYILQSDSRRAVPIELIGFKSVNELQSKFDELITINLTDMAVYGEPDSKALGNLIPAAEELDLSGNLLTCWRSVADITRHLAKLHSLTLRRNKFTSSLVRENMEDLKNSFKTLRVLNLALMELSWNEVDQWSELWPNVQELHLCKNHITRVLSLNTENFLHVRILNLDGNPLLSWSNVKPLSVLPNLDELLLNDCGLQDIHLSSGELPSLRVLALSNNSIDQWIFISELNKLPNLHELQFLANPVLEKADAETNRQLIIAKVLNLRVHNRTKIELSERRGAEIDYLKRYAREWITCGASLVETEQNKHFYCQHPTYSRLIEKWGAPELAEVKDARSALNCSLLNIRFVDKISDQHKTISKKLPGSITVQKARFLGMKLLGIQRTDAKISYLAHKNNKEYEFDNDLREISFYAIADGDDIILRPK